jgi:nitrate reductase NapD
LLENKRPVNSLSRREFLTPHLDSDTLHIASMLIQARPEHLDKVERSLSKLPGLESHGTAGTGKLIITLETANDTALVDTISQIEHTEGVITASLVYHHMDQESGNG